ALNKWDTDGCRPRVDEHALQERYPFIRAFVQMDCKTRRGITELRAALCREVEQVPWVREPFPERWADVRRALGAGGRVGEWERLLQTLGLSRGLSSRKGAKAHMPYAEYRALCTQHRVPDAQEQDSLSEILHNLGAALNYRTDPRLREATVLQPHW